MDKVAFYKEQIFKEAAERISYKDLLPYDEAQNIDKKIKRDTAIGIALGATPTLLTGVGTAKLMKNMGFDGRGAIVGSAAMSAIPGAVGGLIANRLVSPSARRKRELSRLAEQKNAENLLASKGY